RDALLQRIDEVFSKGFPKQAQPTLAKDLKTLQREAREIANAVIIEEPAIHRFTRAADKVLLHPVFGVLFLFALMFVMFQAVFTLATVPMDFIKNAFAALGAWVNTEIPNQLLRSFLSDGLIAGVGSVIVFLPQIVILFAFILVLEASGYM